MLRILIIGGNRFFGKHLAKRLLAAGDRVTLLNRGNIDDGLDSKVERLKADRTDEESLGAVLRNRDWDLVYDQVCYTAAEARLTAGLLKGRCGRLIVTSTESVYDYGADQPEENFDPRTHSFTTEATPNVDYQAAKRQVEAVYTAAFPDVVLPRPSLVVGPDDYTGRLRWHVERVRDGKSIYFPSLDVGADFITSAQMAEALGVIGEGQTTGPVNCTTPGHVPLRELVAMCERATGKRAVIAERHDGENHSPFANPTTKTMNTDRLRTLGLAFPSSVDWLESLVRNLA